MDRYSGPQIRKRPPKMSDEKIRDDEPTVVLPKQKLPVPEFDPDKTLVVEDWSKLSIPNPSPARVKAG